MRIATRLRISATATVAAVIILVPVLYWAYSAYREAQSGHELAEAIQRNFTERASFRDQYFLYREDRVRILWDESKAQSDQLLNSARSRFQAGRETGQGSPASGANSQGNAGWQQRRAVGRILGKA